MLALAPPARQRCPHTPARRSWHLQAIEWAIDMFGAGSVFHLLHVVPEPQMLHLWAGTYIPPGTP